MSDDVWNDEYYTITYKGLLLLSMVGFGNWPKNQWASVSEPKSCLHLKLGPASNNPSIKNNMSKHLFIIEISKCPIRILSIVKNRLHVWTGVNSTCQINKTELPRQLLIISWHQVAPPGTRVWILWMDTWNIFPCIRYFSAGCLAWCEYCGGGGDLCPMVGWQLTRPLHCHCPGHTGRNHGHTLLHPAPSTSLLTTIGIIKAKV